jgi:hypothetical protein
MLHFPRGPWTAASAGVVLLAGVTAAQRPPPRTFDAERAGPPEGITLAALRQPAAGVWTVRREGSNGVLVHTADAAATGFALAIARDASLPHFSIGVRLRFPAAAKAGGLLWHYEDENNHYAALLDLNRQAVSLFRVVAGNRTRLEFEDDLELDPDAWHTMKVVYDGGELSVSLGGIKVFEERVRSGRGAGGRIGLVAAGHAEVWFDDWRIEPRQERGK